MIILNKSMKKIIESDTNKCVNNIERSIIISCVENILEKRIIIKDCLVLENPTFDIYDTVKFKKYYGDFVGFEASQNEINLNIHFDCDIIASTFALTFFDIFNTSLKSKHSDKRFCSILSVDNMNRWIFRFHTIRDNESNWINNDIDQYTSPLLYEII